MLWTLQIASFVETNQTADFGFAACIITKATISTIQCAINTLKSGGCVQHSEINFLHDKCLMPILLVIKFLFLTLPITAIWICRAKLN